MFPENFNNFENLMEKIGMGLDLELQDILLFPVYPMKLFISELFDSKINFSIPVSYSSRGHILAITKPGVWSAFSFFLFSDIGINILTILSVLLISLIISLIKKSINVFFSTIWQLFSVLLSDHLTNVYHSIHERILLGVWLLIAGVVFLGAFSGCLRGLMIRKIPVQSIDSWDELYTSWSDLKIIAPNFHTMSDFANEGKSEMARNFYNRIEVHEPSEFHNPEFFKEIAEKVATGRYAFVMEWYLLHYYKNTLTVVKQLRQSKGFNEYLNFHISKEGYGWSPYVISVINNKNVFIINSLNRA